MISGALFRHQKEAEFANSLASKFAMWHILQSIIVFHLNCFHDLRMCTQGRVQLTDLLRVIAQIKQNP